MTRSRTVPASCQVRASSSAALNELRQRRDAADEPRVKRELATMIFLVGDAVMHPRHSRRRFAVELANRLQHRDLASRAETLRAAGVRRFQRGNQLRFCAIPRHAARRVLLEKSRIGLALKITVRAR